MPQQKEQISLKLFLPLLLEEECEAAFISVSEAGGE